MNIYALPIPKEDIVHSEELRAPAAAFALAFGLGQRDCIRTHYANNYGASIIYGRGTYGFENGLAELAVIHWDNATGFELVYDTPITDDVLGHLTEQEVMDTLDQIKALPPR